MALTEYQQARITRLAASITLYEELEDALTENPHTKVVKNNIEYSFQDLGTIAKILSEKYKAIDELTGGKSIQSAAVVFAR